MLRRRLPEGSRESSLWGRVAGVLDNLPGFPYTTAWYRCPGSSHDPCRALRLPAVLFPNQAVMQLARLSLHSAGVEGSEDAEARSNFLNISGRRGTDVPSSALHLCEQTM